MLRLYPARLAGSVAVPPSKSLLHRELICRFLSGERPKLPADMDDVRYSCTALRALGEGAASVDCGASGTTLRFLLPLAMALGRVGTTFTGTARLMERPMPAALPMERTAEGWRVTGVLMPGRYRLPADGTSQLISGLMMALPLLKEDSQIVLTTSPVSAPYMEMTAAVLARHGVSAVPTAEGWHIPAPQTYRFAPEEAEGDWSAAAFYAVLDALQGGNTVKLTNVKPDSLQGDCAILALCKHLPETVDMRPIPDLLPPLALLAALTPGKVTTFTHAGFLRGKESDRLHAVAVTLDALGAQVMEQPDGLTVRGTEEFRGGVTLDSFDDHRIAMMCGCAALFCRQPIMLRGAGAVTKSYPAFWRDYARLGGRTEEIDL